MSEDSDSTPDKKPGEDKAGNTVVEESKVVRRDKWGARHPLFNAPLKISPVPKVVVTWTETEPCFSLEECIKSVRDLQDIHMDRYEEPDIRHNFLLGGDGSLFEGRGFYAVGTVYPKDNIKLSHLNGTSIEIAFIDKCTNKPTPAMLSALSECMSHGISANFIERRSECYWVAKNNVLHVTPPMLVNK